MTGRAGSVFLQRLRRVKSGCSGDRQGSGVSAYGAARVCGAVFRVVAPPFLLPALLLVLICPAAAHAVELRLQEVAASAAPIAPAGKSDQLPHSRVARGDRDIAAAWLAGATDRYGHGVLGDALEASRLVVETRAGRRLQIELPAHRVFEDLEPRLADLDGDSRDEIIVVESDINLGASLAVYSVDADRLVKRAATAFLGQSNRWLNPLGVGDFDGDGRPDIALVATPHIGGILRLYRFDGAVLSPFAEARGVSTHRLGSTELALGRVVPNRPRDWILLPDQAQRALLLLEWSNEGWRELARVQLPARLDSALLPLNQHRWRFRVEGGKSFMIKLTR